MSPVRVDVIETRNASAYINQSVRLKDVTAITEYRSGTSTSLIEEYPCLKANVSIGCYDSYGLAAIKVKPNLAKSDAV